MVSDITKRITKKIALILKLSIQQMMIYKKEKNLLFVYGKFVIKLINAAEVKFGNKNQQMKDVLKIKPKTI